MGRLLFDSNITFLTCWINLDELIHFNPINVVFFISVTYFFNHVINNIIDMQAETPHFNYKSTDSV